MIYDTLSKYVLDNDYITPDRKYEVYLEMKQVYIDAAKDSFEYLCKFFNGSEDRTGQSVVTCERAREVLGYSEEELNETIEILIAEKITELQGGMIVL